MNNVHYKKNKFSIGTGISVALVWILVTTSIAFSFFSLMMVIRGLIIPVTIPSLANYAGFWATRKILDARPWPEKPGILNVLGKWVAIFAVGIVSLSTITFCVGFYFYLIPLLVIPPTIIGWVWTTILLIRRLRFGPKAVNP